MEAREVMEIIRNRRSVHKFKDEEIEWGKIVEILHAGRLAPIAGNVHNVKFIVIRDEAQIKKVGSKCEGQEWISNVPVLIVVLGEPEKAERMYGTRGRFLYTIQNCAAAGMNMILAAESEGLSSCWIGSYDEEGLRYVLGLPENVYVHLILAIGYKNENPNMPPKPRIEHVAYFEKYWNRRKLAVPQGQFSRNIMKWSKKAKKKLEKIGGKAEEKVAEKVNSIKGRLKNE